MNEWRQENRGRDREVSVDLLQVIKLIDGDHIQGPFFLPAIQTFSNLQLLLHSISPFLLITAKGSKRFKSRGLLNMISWNIFQE